MARINPPRQLFWIGSLIDAMLSKRYGKPFSALEPQSSYNDFARLGRARVRIDAHSMGTRLGMSVVSTSA